jgi:hypothetical protein
MRKEVVCQEKGVPMIIDLDQRAFVRKASSDFKKEEYTPLEDLCPSNGKAHTGH